MTDQPHAPGAPGNSGAWQPVPGGGDYDPDQTMHVSFAAQLPPQPVPGEDPLGAHGPAGDAERDPATQWSIPVIPATGEDPEADSGEFSVGAYTQPWEPAPPAAPQAFGSGMPPGMTAGMFGQGAAAAQAAQAEAAAQARAAVEARAGHARALEGPRGASGDHGEPAAHGAPGGHSAPAGHGAPSLSHGDHLTGQWEMPFGGPDQGPPAPWLPAHPPAADAAWSAVVDDPERLNEPASYRSPGAAADDYAADGAQGGHPADRSQISAAPHAESAPDDDQGRLTPGSGPADGLDALDRLAALDGLDAVPGLELPGLDALAALEGAAAEDDPLDPDTGSSDASDLQDPSDAGEGPGAEEAAAEPEPLPETRSEHPLASYLLRVNGTERPVTDAWLGESLLYVLRERLGLAGAKDGCEQGECGACSVQVDGRLVASCLVPAATAAGSEVRTVEGLSVGGRPSDVQTALAESGAVQCGFCIPGMAMTVHDLLEGNHKPTDLDIRQALSGNLCRCSGYRGVIEAVREVVTARDTDDDPAFSDEARVPHQGGPATPGGTV